MFDDCGGRIGKAWLEDAAVLIEPGPASKRYRSSPVSSFEVWSPAVAITEDYLAHHEASLHEAGWPITGCCSLVERSGPFMKKSITPISVKSLQALPADRHRCSA